MKKEWKNKGTILTIIFRNELSIPTSPNLISVFLESLLDTGCLAGDFVARRIVERYNIQPILQSTAKLSVCSGLDNTCYGIIGAGAVQTSKRVYKVVIGL